MSPRPSTVATTIGAVICLGLLTLTLAVFVTAIVQGTGGAGLFVVGALCVLFAGATALLYRRRARAMAPEPAAARMASRIAAPRVPAPSRRPSPRPR